MSNDEILLQIEQCVAEAVAQGEKMVWFRWERSWLNFSYSSPHYEASSYICRIHVASCRKGLTWRQRQRIGWRLDLLRKKGIIR